MNSKEIKINIEVNIAGERITLNTPFSRQDAVRKTEAEIGLLFKQLRERFPGRGQKELLAMMVYDFASRYFSLADQREEEINEAGNLLEEAERLCRNENPDEEYSDLGSFDIS